MYKADKHLGCLNFVSTWYCRLRHLLTTPRSFYDDLRIPRGEKRASSRAQPNKEDMAPVFTIKNRIIIP